MTVSSLVFSILPGGGAMAIGLLVFLGALVVKSPKLKAMFSVGAPLAGVAYLMWFELRVTPQTISIYTVEDCRSGHMQYHLPFGDGEDMTFDKELLEEGEVRTVIQNLARVSLVFHEVVYIDEGVNWGAEPKHEGYIIRSGETHGVYITEDNFFFLEEGPEEVEDSGWTNAVRKYEVTCRK